MNDKVIFYYNPMSRGRIVYWLLEELEADYEIKLLKWETKDHKSPDYLKINPMGQIPAIMHKGAVVTETPAICAYLADAFPKNKLAPALSDPLRGTYYRWLFFAASSLEYAMFDKKYPRKETLDPAHTGYSSYSEVINTLEGAVSNGYLTGKFSAADVFLASAIGWGLFMKGLEARPAFENYLKLCMDRPGHKRFMEKAGPIG